MPIIRPRLNDFHNLTFTQSEVDFAIPFLDEDIPLYVDPFLLWKSPSMQDQSLHLNIINAFNSIGNLYIKGEEEKAIKLLIELTECEEVRLGNSKTGIGKRIGISSANSILSLFQDIPQINKQGIQHFEVIQLLVDGLSKDRISDITCSLIKSFLIDYTIDQCEKHMIPLEKTAITSFDTKSLSIKNEEIYLPINPESNLPILLVPKRWLRYNPWISYDSYFDGYYRKEVEKNPDLKEERIKVLNFNRHNYDIINLYLSIKEKHASECKNDPLFTQISIISSKRKVKTVLDLPTGKTGNADIQYENVMGQLLTSFLYPNLDFAKEQSRIDSGTQIRDLVFYNNRSFDFLKDIYDDYNSRQIVVELKNVAQVERDHVNQLNRYLTDQFGKFGIIFTRKPVPRSIFQNTIDLWSGQRRCILIMDDSDLALMGQVYDSKQRLPIEVVKKKYIDFVRSCPS